MIGFERFSLFGIQEFAIHQNRLDQRLSGPFASVGLTAEYLALNVLLLAYLLIHERKKSRKTFLYGLMGANIAFLVATGNRGGFISLIAGGLLFLYLFRRELGFFRITSMALAGIIFLFIASVLIVTYTPFDRLYERIANTKIEGGIPDTRREVWPDTWRMIKEKPILGHGPRLSRHNVDHVNLLTGKRGHVGYPHNLYLFILYTLGVVGLVAYLIFFSAIFFKLRKASGKSRDNPLLAGIPKLGTLLIFVFLVDQIKVEFLRYHLGDYQHYIFMMFGLFVGFSDRMTKEENADFWPEPTAGP
jgi:O-antigen ligase